MLHTTIRAAGGGFDSTVLGTLNQFQRMRDVSWTRGKNSPNQTKPPKPNLRQAGLFLVAGHSASGMTIVPLAESFLLPCLSFSRLWELQRPLQTPPNSSGEISPSSLRLSSVQSVLSWTRHGRSCIQNPCGDIPREVHCSNPTASPKGQTWSSCRT